MKKIKQVGLMLLIAVAATITVAMSSCERRSLEDENHTTARIPLGTVWSRANIDPQNVTALFYDQSDGKLVVEHRFEENSNRIQSHVSLPIGTYTVIVFNEIRDQIADVGVRGYENLNTLEVYTKIDPTVRARTKSDTYVSAPDVFAAALVRDFDVTAEMVAYTAGQEVEVTTKTEMLAKVERLVGLTPLRKMSEIKVIMHVKGLNNARMPALVDVRNLSAAYLVNVDKNSTELCTHQFTMNNRTYDAGSNRNGTISASFTTFGVPGDRLAHEHLLSSPLILDILFQLVDADRTVVNRVVDITNLIQYSADDNGTIIIEVNIDLTNPLPDVVPEGSGGNSGFTPDLTDWSVVEVPLTI